jgi:hypothetical protein
MLASTIIPSGSIIAVAGTTAFCLELALPHSLQRNDGPPLEQRKARETVFRSVDEIGHLLLKKIRRPHNRTLLYCIVEMAAAVGVSSDVEWWNLTGTSSVIGTSPRRENVEDAAPHAIGFSVALAQRVFGSMKSRR